MTPTPPDKDELDEILFCDSSCGVNASDALGYDVSCTCGNERLRQELEALIASKVEEARLIELDLLEQAINTEQYGLTLDATRYKLMRLKTLQSKEGRNEDTTKSSS